METVPLKGRAAILADMKNSYFYDVTCGRSDCTHLTFAITINGILCEFDESRTLSKVIELHVDRSYCIYSDEENLYIGCSNGTILIFRQKNLEFLASLPRPHCLGTDISKGLDNINLITGTTNHGDIKHPDCIALCYNMFDYYLCTIYNDHSLYVWDIKDVNKVKKIDSHLFHSSCCWSIDINMNLTNSISSCLPNDSLITSSSDNTLRIWSLAELYNNKSDAVSCNHDSNYQIGHHSKIKQSNIYSKELLHIIYIDNDLSALCDTEYINNNSANNNHDSNNNNNNNHVESVSDNIHNSATNSSSNITPTTINDMQQNHTNLMKLGARCLKISPLGSHLASGDRNGNIRIYDLKHLESIVLIEAHDSEILYLQYSSTESSKLLLASASRDRLIHIFDAKKNYELIQTLDDHSAAITSVRFCFNPIEKQFYLISCGSDKSIIFRAAQEAQCVIGTSENMIKNQTSFFESNTSKLQFTRTSYACEKMTFYDMVVDPTKNYINTVSQDRTVRTYSIKDGKKLRQFKGSLNEDGYLLKMDIDRTGTLLATSCTDKCVYIYDLNSCECLAYICGHSELIVDLKFTNDNKYLITISVDSCIFIWKLNLLTTHSHQNINNNTINMSNRKSQLFLSINSQPTLANYRYTNEFSLESILDNLNNETEECETENYITWAKKSQNNIPAYQLNNFSHAIDNLSTSDKIKNEQDSENVKSKFIEDASNLITNSDSKNMRRSRAVWDKWVSKLLK